MPISAPPSLSGELALWLFDEGSGNVAENYFASAPYDGVNLCLRPEQTFNTTWTKSNATVTDYAANNPNGVATASRVQLTNGTSGQIIYDQLDLPAAQYTLSVYVKSNTGADQNIRLATVTDGGGLTNSSNLSVTDAAGWVRVSLTVTIPGGSKLKTIAIKTDGTNTNDILIWGVQLEAGASATAYRLQEHDFFISTLDGPSWNSTGVQDSTGGKKGCAVQNQPTTFAACTVYAAVKLNSTAGTYNLVLTDLNGFTSLGAPAAYGQVSPGQQGHGGYLAGGSAFTQADIKDDNWHVLAVVWTGTQVKYYVDGTLVRTASGSTGWTSKGLFLGNTAGLGWRGERGILALYSDDHSATDVRDWTAWARTEMAARSVTMTNLQEFVVFEGDSNTQATGLTSHAKVAMDAIGAETQWVNLAVSGSQTSHVTARAAQADDAIPPTKQHPIYFCLVGINDFNVGGSSAATVYNSLKSIWAARRAAGFIVVASTLQACKSSAGSNTFRNSLNTLIKSDPSLYDVLADYGDDPVVGPDDAADDTTYYNVDKLHWNQAGHNYVAANITQPAIEAALLISLGRATLINGGFGRQLIRGLSA